MAQRLSLIQSRSLYVGTANSVAPADGNLVVTGTATATTFIGALTGNASTASNVAYAGLTGTIPTWNQNTTGSAATLTTARTLTIGSTGKTFNGSANVAWTLAEIGAYAATNPSGFTNNTGTVTSVAALTIGTTGTNITSTVATGTTTPVITINVPDASTTARGVVTTGAQTFAGVKTFSSTIAGSINGNATTATTAANSNTVAGLAPPHFFNNMGQTHSTRTSFDATNPSYDYGWRYVQGAGNGPSTGGAQFYSVYVGLGIDYPATGTGSYGMMLAVPRVPLGGTPRLSVRYNENGTFGAWQDVQTAPAAGSANYIQNQSAAVQGAAFRINGTGSVENMAIGGAGSFGGSAKSLFIAQTTTAPNSNPTGGVVTYVEDGIMKARSVSGNITFLTI